MTSAEWRALEDVMLAVLAAYQTRLAAARDELADLERNIAALREIARGA